MPSAIKNTSTRFPAFAGSMRGHKPARTRLAGIGTAVPQHYASQTTAREFMERVLGASHADAPPAQLALLKRIYAHSGIDNRYCVLPDYLRSDPAENTFFPPNAALEPFPTTSQRMAIYECESLPLAEAAARQALLAAEVPASRVTHLVISTCTGFFAPGLDVLLTQSLGLPAGVKRTVLGFMGCYAGVSGLRVCHEITQADPAAIVLQVAVELCSLHFQKDLTPDTLVANALFADGAAAAVYGTTDQLGDTGMAEIIATRTELCPESLGGMSWKIGDTGFVMRLDTQVPALIEQTASSFLQNLTIRTGVEPHEIGAWAVHPGGRRILESVSTALQIPKDSLQSSYDILREYGNMSSATVLFVLQRELQRSAASGSFLAAMAFGPGLTTEGALLQTCT